MGDVALPIPVDDRHCDSVGAEDRVFQPGRGEKMLQCPVDRYVASREVRADFEQDIARIDNGLPGSIDVNETRVRVNEI